MLTKLPPWSDKGCDEKEVYEYIKKTKRGPGLPPGLTNDCRDFLKKCMRMDYRKRSTAKELMSHPFVGITLARNSPLLASYQSLINSHGTFSMMHSQTTFMKPPSSRGRVGRTSGLSSNKGGTNP